MPEIIEIKKYVDFIKKHVLNKTILRINILNGRYKKNIDKLGGINYYNLIKDLPLKILDVLSKGKLIYFILDNEYIILNTLGLKGGWIYYLKNEDEYDTLINIDYDKNMINHKNIEFVFEDNSLFFCDALSFGTIKIINNCDELEKKLKLIGPDVMDYNTNYDIFKNRLLMKKSKTIGEILMNQKIISGIGNYLRADILWLSNVSPLRLIKNLTNDDMYNIYYNVKMLTWFRYDIKEGEKRGYINNTDMILKEISNKYIIYGKDIDLYGNDVIKEDLNGRNIYYVPVLQI